MKQLCALYVLLTGIYVYNATFPRLLTCHRDIDGEHSPSRLECCWSLVSLVFLKGNKNIRQIFVNNGRYELHSWFYTYVIFSADCIIYLESFISQRIT